MKRNTITKTLAGLLLAFISAPAFAALSSDPCVPDGGSGDYDFDRPDLPEPNSEWVDNGTGSPEAFNSDFGFDTPMGDANPSADSSSASVPISNDGGDLSGPNGEDVGAIFGGCADVYVRWTYRVEHSFTFNLSQKIAYKPGGVGGSTTFGGSYTFTWFTEHEIESPAREICPC